MRKDFLPGIFFTEGFWEKVFVHVDGVGVVPDCEPAVLDATQDVAAVVPRQTLHHAPFIYRQQIMRINQSTDKERKKIFPGETSKERELEHSAYSAVFRVLTPIL